MSFRSIIWLCDPNERSFGLLGYLGYRAILLGLLGYWAIGAIVAIGLVEVFDLWAIGQFGLWTIGTISQQSLIMKSFIFSLNSVLVSAIGSANAFLFATIETNNKTFADKL